MNAKDILDLSVIIPCHNELHNIPILLSRLVKVFKRNNINGEIIVVDDNSTDDTSAKVTEIAGKYPFIKLIKRRDGICGVGLTLKEGFRQAMGKVVITMDGDLSHDPADIPRFMKEIAGGAELVIGARYKISGGEADMPASRWFISGGYNNLARLLFGTKLSDLTTGYRAIRKNALDKLGLKADGFAIHAEIHLKALNRNLKIAQIPIVYHRRLGGTSKLRYLKVGFSYLKVLTVEFFKGFGSRK